jgi:hypothetical protein
MGQVRDERRRIRGGLTLPAGSYRRRVLPHPEGGGCRRGTPLARPLPLRAQHPAGETLVPEREKNETREGAGLPCEFSVRGPPFDPAAPKH